VSTSIRITADGNVRVGVLEGDVDLSSARDLTGEIRSDVPADAAGLVLDLSQVRYLDSTGVSMLLDLHRSMVSRRQLFIVVLPRTSHLWRVFEITGLPSILRICESLAEAKEAALTP
jgi:anti-sigma B factor antagonist